MGFRLIVFAALGTHLPGINRSKAARTACWPKKSGNLCVGGCYSAGSGFCAILLFPLLSCCSHRAALWPRAATTTPTTSRARPPSAADAAKENQRKTDEFAEAAQAINGPAGNPECVWLGRRVVRLMWRDDLDTAFRHLDLYDRFGCPGGHIQATFRCLTRFGDQIDPKVAETLDSRVHACWINPGAQPQTAAAAARSAAPAATSGSAAPPPAASPAPAAAPLACGKIDQLLKPELQVRSGASKVGALKNAIASYQL